MQVVEDFHADTVSLLTCHRVVDFERIFWHAQFCQIGFCNPLVTDYWVLVGMHKILTHKDIPS